MASKSDVDDEVSRSVFAPFKMVWNLSMALLLLWFVACAIQITYVRHNDLEPRSHMLPQLDYYVAMAGSHADWVNQVADKGYWLVFEATQAQRTFFAPTAQISSQDNLGKATRRGVLALFHQDIVVIAFTTLLFGIKLAMAALMAVMLSVVLLAAGVDGLVQRYIRKNCFGNESSSIYHRAKHLNHNLLPPLALGIFLCSPVMLNPAWVFVPLGLVAAVALRFQATYYKKYL